MKYIDEHKAFMEVATRKAYPGNAIALWNILFAEFNRSFWEEELLFSERDLARLWKESNIAVRDNLQFLCEHGHIIKTPTTRGTIIRMVFGMKKTCKVVSGLALPLQRVSTDLALSEKYILNTPKDPPPPPPPPPPQKNFGLALPATGTAETVGAEGLVKEETSMTAELPGAEGLVKEETSVTAELPATALAQEEPFDAWDEVFEQWAEDPLMPLLTEKQKEELRTKYQPKQVLEAIDTAWLNNRPDEKGHKGLNFAFIRYQLNKAAKKKRRKKHEQRDNQTSTGTVPERERGTDKPAEICTAETRTGAGQSGGDGQTVQRPVQVGSVGTADRNVEETVRADERAFEPAQPEQSTAGTDARADSTDVRADSTGTDARADEGDGTVDESTDDIYAPIDRSKYEIHPEYDEWGREKPLNAEQRAKSEAYMREIRRRLELFKRAREAATATDGNNISKPDGHRPDLDGARTLCAESGGSAAGSCAAALDGRRTEIDARTDGGVGQVLCGGTRAEGTGTFGEGTSRSEDGRLGLGGNTDDRRAAENAPRYEQSAVYGSRERDNEQNSEQGRPSAFQGEYAQVLRNLLPSTFEELDRRRAESDTRQTWDCGGDWRRTF